MTDLKHVSSIVQHAQSLVASASHPERQHPYSDFSLLDAVLIAVNAADLSERPLPASLTEVREILCDLNNRAHFNWITGSYALDLLNAELDGTAITA